MKRFNSSNVTVEAIPEQPGQEGWASYLAGHIGTGARKVGEGLLSLPGEITQGLVNLASYDLPPELKNEVPKVPELVKREGIEKLGKKVLPKSLYREPQHLGEDLLQGLGETIPGLTISALTGGIAPTGVKNALSTFGKAFGLPALGKFSKHGVKVLGGGETAQAIAEIGAPIGAMSATKFLPKQLVGSLKKGDTGGYLQKSVQGPAYEEAQQLAEGFEMLAPKVKDDLMTKLDDVFAYATPSNKGLRQILLDVDQKVKKGVLNVNEAKRGKQALNEMLRTKGLTDKQHGVLKSTVGSLNEFIGDFSKQSPEHGKAWSLGENLTRSIAKIKQAKTKIWDNTKNLKLNTPATWYMFGLGNLVPIAKYAAMPALALVKYDPRAQQYIADAFKYAAKDNVPGIVRSVSNLDKLISHKEKKRFSNKEIKIS